MSVLICDYEKALYIIVLASSTTEVLLYFVFAVSSLNFFLLRSHARLIIILYA